MIKLLFKSVLGSGKVNILEFANFLHYTKIYLLISVPDIKTLLNLFLQLFFMYSKSIKMPN